jgi:hypothetical protein
MQPLYTCAQSCMHSPPQSHHSRAELQATTTTVLAWICHHSPTTRTQSCNQPPPQSHGFGGWKGEEDRFGAWIWSKEGRGGWEKEEKEGEVHGRRLGHENLHAEWKEENEGEAHRRRACGRRLGKMDLQRRAHRFVEEEGTRFFTGGEHTTGGNGLTSFSYLLSVHANFFMKCLIECLMKCLIEFLMK